MSTTLIGVLAVAAVAGTALNLFLILALARKLRELGGHARQPMENGGSMDGRPVGEFAATDLAGAAIGPTELAAGRSLVAFLLPGCGPCGDIVEALHAGVDPKLDLIVFVGGRPGGIEHTEFVAGLPERARVVAIEGIEDHPASKAFGVTVFPTIVWVRDGVLEMSAHRMSLATSGARPAAAGVPG